MTGKVQLITFGGTLLMKDHGQGFVPHYTLDEVARHGGTDLASLDFMPEVKALAYPPIDSINFDIATHYPELRNAVLGAIRYGHVPVIAGGTDTLKFYGSLLDADLRQLQRAGVIRKIPPVIILSSMHSFDEDRNHVFRLLSAARVAADEAVNEGKSGVLALVANDPGVSSATLLAMQDPVDKLSGTQTTGFIGTNGLRIDPDTKKHGNVLPHYDERRHATKLQPPALPFAQRLVAPPIEASTSALAVGQFMNEVAKNHGNYPFDAIILKVPLTSAGWAQHGDLVAQQVAKLRAIGVDVLLVNDPVAYRNELKFPQGTGVEKRQARYLVEAGAIATSGLTSAQAYTQALLLSQDGTPAYFTQERDEAVARAKKHTSEHPEYAMDHMAGRIGGPKAMAIEYVPDAAAYDLMLRTMKAQGIKHVVSVNCTDGAMAEQHVKTLQKYPDLEVTCTFKYAGRQPVATLPPERARMQVYAPARLLAALPNVHPGGAESPAALMAKLERGRA